MYLNNNCNAYKQAEMLSLPQKASMPQRCQFSATEFNAIPTYKLLFFMNVDNIQMFIREYRDRISMFYISHRRR